MEQRKGSFVTENLNPFSGYGALGLSETTNDQEHNKRRSRRFHQVLVGRGRWFNQSIIQHRLNQTRLIFFDKIRSNDHGDWIAPTWIVLRKSWIVRKSWLAAELQSSETIVTRHHYLFEVVVEVWYPILIPVVVWRLSPNPGPLNLRVKDIRRRPIRPSDSRRYGWT